VQVECLLGLALFESGAAGEALDVLQAYERRSPGDARVPHLLGLCLMQQDRLEEGAGQLERALQRQAGNLAASVSLATAYVALGRLEEAERLLAGPLQGQERAETLLAKGMLLNARGKHREASAELQRAVGMNPRLPGLHNQLGYTQMLLGDDAAAIAEFRKELAMRPLDFQANANLGWILLRERKFAEAETALARALQSRPDQPGALFLQGQLWFQSGETEKARVNLERVVAARPEFRAAHVLLARTYGKLNRPEDVRRTQAVIARLTQEEQARNAGRNDSYGGQSRTPVTEPASRGRMP
jgi:tetratricopeptide (TPR) repeat protein